jgi:DNA-binding GntR family transcriptional regulator
VADASDSRPPYLVIAERLRERIAAGEFPPGTQLPTGRELAVEFDVAPNTVLAAIRELRDEGLVASQQGRGTFVRDGAVEAIRGGSAEFRLLSEKLDAITSALELLTARVSELEDALHESRRSPE